MLTPLNFEELKSLASKLHSDAIEVRRHLHMFPELSWQEDKTILYLKQKIAAIQKNSLYELVIEEKKGGLTIDLNISSKLPRFLFRADIDALPIQEETYLSFASLNPGVMHACGHDMHAAILLSALKGLSTYKLQLIANLRFVFQRAEEVPWEISGGECLINENVCVGVDKVFGLHISSTTDCGYFLSHPGKMLSNPCHFSFEIKARGGHVSSPYQGSNAIDVATDIHILLRNFIQNQVALRDKVCLVPSISKAGVACNVMPGRAQVCYSLRNFLETSDKCELLNKIKKLIEGIANLYEDTSIENFLVINGFPILENNKEVFEETSKLLENHGLQTGLSPSMFAGEDFAYFLNQKPGCFWMLGAKQGEGYSHHTSLFNPDESAMAQGILFWLLLATQIT